MHIEGPITPFQFVIHPPVHNGPPHLPFRDRLPNDGPPTPYGDSTITMHQTWCAWKARHKHQEGKICLLYLSVTTVTIRSPLWGNDRGGGKQPNK